MRPGIGAGQSAAMTLDLNAGKLLGFFALIWPLLVVALLVDPGAWSAWQVAAFCAFPLVATGLLWAMARRRWRLEVTPEALIHHTLGRTERFDWRAIANFEVRGLPLPHMVGPRILRFTYPAAAADGAGPPRTLMLVFGDQSPTETAITLERFRALYAKAPAPPARADRPIRLRLSWVRLLRWLFPLFFVAGAGLALVLPYATRFEILLAVVVSAAIFAGLARGRSLVLGEEGLVVERWGRRTVIPWASIEEATLARRGPWPFRLPVLTVTAMRVRRVRIGDLYGDQTLDRLLPLIESRRTEALSALEL